MAGIGSFINDITGASSSARHQFQNQIALQHNAQNFAKWQMQNAHQIETADLQAAGLNPVLSAGASGGASAGVTEGSASAGTASGNPLDMLNTALSIKNTMAQADKTEAETNNINADTKLKNQTFEWTPELNKTMIKLQNAQTAKEHAHELDLLADVVKKDAETFKLKLETEMTEMDVAKRQKYYHDEVELYKKQLKAGFVNAGFEGNTTYQAIDRAFNTVGKVFSAGVNYNYGQNTSHSTSNVNVHNSDYNPERKAKIGF